MGKAFGSSLPDRLVLLLFEAAVSKETRLHLFGYLNLCRVDTCVGNEQNYHQNLAEESILLNLTLDLNTCN